QSRQPLRDCRAELRSGSFLAGARKWQGEERRWNNGVVQPHRGTPIPTPLHDVTVVRHRIYRVRVPAAECNAAVTGGNDQRHSRPQSAASNDDAINAGPVESSASWSPLLRAGIIFGRYLHRSIG